MQLTSNHILDFDDLSNDVKQALEEFQQSVKLLSANKWNLEFNNKDQYHASIVMSAIFKTAVKHIKIFCGSFSGEVSNNPMYISSLAEAIDRGVAVDVVTETTPNQHSRCLKLLLHKKSENKPVSISTISESYRNRLNSKGKQYLRHFSFGDDQMFRYETETDTFKAICNFDDKANVQQLSTNFAYLKTHSELYSAN